MHRVVRRRRAKVEPACRTCSQAGQRATGHVPRLPMHVMAPSHRSPQAHHHVRRRVELDPRVVGARGLYDILTAAVAPRPIAWITTVDPSGSIVNAAPFSWFNAVCADPPMVMVSVANHADGRPKDTMRNIRATGEFVVNVAPKALLQAMVASSADYAPDASETDALGLRTQASRTVRPRRLTDSPVHLECRLEREIPLGRGAGTNLVLAEVVHIAADDTVLDARGTIDPEKLVLMARMGGAWYCDTSTHINVPRPRAPERRT